MEGSPLTLHTTPNGICNTLLATWGSCIKKIEKNPYTFNPLESLIPNSGVTSPMPGLSWCTCPWKLRREQCGIRPGLGDLGCTCPSFLLKPMLSHETLEVSTERPMLCIN